jgi:hypothetical protein
MVRLVQVKARLRTRQVSLLSRAGRAAEAHRAAKPAAQGD